MSETGGRAGDDDRLAHLREGELAAFLDGGLTAVERERVESHIDICDACRAELVDIGRAVGHRGVPVKGAPTPLRRRWWVPAAAAAGIVAVLLLPRVVIRQQTTTEQTHTPRLVDGEGQGRIDFISPADDVTVSAARMVFTWHPVVSDAYRISLSTESGDSVWAKETADTTAHVPSTVSLTPGGSYFWRVDALANGIAATTRTHRVNVSR